MERDCVISRLNECELVLSGRVLTARDGGTLCPLNEKTNRKAFLDKMNKFRRFMRKLFNQRLKRTSRNCNIRKEFEDETSKSSVLDQTRNLCKRASRMFSIRRNEEPEISPESREMIAHSLNVFKSTELKSCRKENNLSNLSFMLLSAANGLEKRFRWSSPLVTFAGLASFEYYELQQSRESLESLDSVEFEARNVPPQELIPPKNTGFKTLWHRKETKLWDWKPRVPTAPLVQTSTTIIKKEFPTNPNNNLMHSKLKRKEKFTDVDIAPVKSCLKSAVTISEAKEFKPPSPTLEIDTDLLSDAETTLVESDSSITSEISNSFDKTRSSLDAGYLRKMQYHKTIAHEAKISALNQSEPPQSLLKTIIKPFVGKFSKKSPPLRREERKLQDFDLSIETVLERNSSELQRDSI